MGVHVVCAHRHRYNPQRRNNLVAHFKGLNFLCFVVNTQHHCHACGWASFLDTFLRDCRCTRLSEMKGFSSQLSQTNQDLSFHLNTHVPLLHTWGQNSWLRYLVCGRGGKGARPYTRRARKPAGFGLDLTPSRRIVFHFETKKSARGLL